MIGWLLGVGFWELGVRFWELDFGSWDLGVGILNPCEVSLSHKQVHSMATSSGIIESIHEVLSNS